MEYCLHGATSYQQVYSWRAHNKHFHRIRWKLVLGCRKFQMSRLQPAQQCDPFATFAESLVGSEEIKEDQDARTRLQI